MRGCTETDNTVVIGCYKADLGDRNRNGLRHCQFDPVSSGYQKLLLTSAAVNHNRLWGTSQQLERCSTSVGRRKRRKIIIVDYMKSFTSVTKLK